METAENKEKLATGPAAPAGVPELGGLSDDELLRMRICDLKLKIPGTELEPRIENFYRELAAKGISFKPVCYLSNELLCPEGTATIALPFYLAQPLLKKREDMLIRYIAARPHP